MPICLETKRSKYLSLNIVSYFCNGTIFSGRFLPLIIELIINVGTWRCNEMRNKLCTDFEDGTARLSVGVIWKPFLLVLSPSSHFNFSVRTHTHTHTLAAPPPLGNQSSATKLRARHPGMARKLIPAPLPQHAKKPRGIRDKYSRTVHNACPLSWVPR